MNITLGLELRVMKIECNATLKSPLTLRQAQGEIGSGRHQQLLRFGALNLRFSFCSIL